MDINPVLSFPELLCGMRWMSLNALWPNPIGRTVHNDAPFVKRQKNKALWPKTLPDSRTDDKGEFSCTLSSVSRSDAARLCLACKCSINLVVHYATRTIRLHMQLWYSSLKKQCFDKRRPQMLAAAEFALCGEASGLGRCTGTTEDPSA